MDLKPFTRELQDVRAVVLGATSGIGRATALALADAGADVIVHGKTSVDAAHAVATEVRGLGSRSHVFMADLSDRAACDHFAQQAWEKWDGLDAWLQFAGADVLTGPGRALSFDAKLDLLLAVDLVATMRLTREIGRRMKARGEGKIVTMSWDQAETGMEGDSGELFGAVKGAITAFTKSLALSLAPYVRVNAVAPGWIKTSWGQQASSAWQERVFRETPLARWGTPEDVASTACFLASPRSGFLTGQIVRVNGGAVR